MWENQWKHKNNEVMKEAEGNNTDGTNEEGEEVSVMQVVDERQ